LNLSLENDDDYNIEFVMCGLCVPTEADDIELEEETLNDVVLTDNYDDVIVNNEIKVVWNLKVLSRTGGHVIPG
jgi:hypothetical protein